VLDVVVRDAWIVDGSGGNRYRGDIGWRDGKIVDIGSVEESARRTIQADGRIVCPGFVDVHTHFDVQGFWDPALTPSCLHGVTTVLGGNCGFTVHPLNEDAADYLIRLLAHVEGMSLSTLETGVPLNWRTTSEYFERLDGTLALNAGFMVGHSAVRRVAMGADAVKREATDEELASMQRLVRESLEAGAIGFSSSWSVTHNDKEGNPVPSRFATKKELVRLAAECRAFPGTSLEFIPNSGGAFTEDEADTAIQMSRAAARPLNWNVIFPNAQNLNLARQKLELGDRAKASGAKIVGLVMPASAQLRLNFMSGFLLEAIPGWAAPMALPVAEKLKLLRSRSGRQMLARYTLTPEAADSSRFFAWDTYVITDTFSPETERYRGMSVADIATTEQKDPFDALLDIVCADDLKTVFSEPPPEVTVQDWQATVEICRDPRAIIGGSDAGAHLDFLSTFNYTTVLLQEVVRKHGLMSLEEAIYRLTTAPAKLYGLKNRGLLTEGYAADVLVFDERTIGTEAPAMRYDLPADGARLFANAIGLDHVFVNGSEILASGSLTGVRPGRLLRAGRDTETPTMS
jgi:N-acyl-D-aspartate/D-glutamate deacylase